MFCCGGGGSSSTDTPEAAAAALKAKQLAKEQVKEMSKDVQVTKILLLGAGESGKSTIFKQMKVIHKDGYSEAERKGFRQIVRNNCIQSIKAVLEFCIEKDDPKEPWMKEKMPADLEALWTEFGGPDSDDEDLTKEGAIVQTGELITKMWKHPHVQKAYDKRNEFQLNDSAYYYLNDRLHEIFTASYVPDDQDVLRSRVRTTGIVQSDFTITKDKAKLPITMFDVGGQRNERRKWIHCFDHVNVVIFVAAISEFDQVLFEDDQQNRMQESIDLFQQIVNSKWFNKPDEETDFILFLNKKDLFLDKISDKDGKKGKVVKDYLKVPDAMAQHAELLEGNDEAKLHEYFKNWFMSQKKNKKQTVYTHVTTATDTNNITVVFNAIVNMILEKNMKEAGLG